MRKRTLITLINLSAFVLLLSGCGSNAVVSPVPPTIIPQANSATQSSDLDANALLESRCSECHSLARVTSKAATADQWQATVDRMIGHGAQLSANDVTFLVQYLAENFK